MSLDETEKLGYIQLGDSITTEMQKILVQNVSSAIQQKGTEYAVAFCNTRAMPLTDSISKLYGLEISRLSDKNRNPINALQNPNDHLAWEKFQTKDQSVVLQDNEGNVYFYKPIYLGMPTCLQCHGGKNDISESTFESIKLYYPDDQAIGYQMGELRGMWKLQWK